MRRLRAALIRLASVFGSTKRDRDLDQELEAHVQMLTEHNVRAGMPPAEARRQALARFDGLDAVREAYRDQRGLPLLETTMQDARYALRTLGRSRGATLIGIIVMALAIGANTAVFSVVHAVLRNPLPYPNTDRIVTLTYLSSGGLATGNRARQVSVPDFLDWQAHSTSFDAMAYYSTGRASVMAGAAAEYTVVSRVTADFFRVFATQPAAGRLFAKDELIDGAAGAAVVSDRYARQQFADPERAVGRVLRIFTQSIPIVGVLPPSFDYPSGTDVWFPADEAGNRARAGRRGNNFRAVGLVRADVGLPVAQAEMTTISDRLGQQYPDTNRDVRVVLTPILTEIVGDVRSLLYLLFGAVSVVLLVACATMATLLLAKATARVPEMAVRTALGASRARIIKQLLVEALVQSFAAGALGILIAVWGTRALVALSPPNVPRLAEVSISTPVLLFAFGLCLFVSVLFGLPPAIQASRVDVQEPLRQSAGRLVGGRGSRTREWLVVGEIALAVVLVATGTLLVRSLVMLQRTELGFDPTNIVVMQTTARATGPDWSDSRQFFRGLLDDVSSIPGVVAAGAMMAPPGAVSSESGYWIDRMPEQSPLSTARAAVMNVVTPGTFAALGVPIRQGRDIADSDTRNRPHVVIINEAVAQTAFDGRDPIGRVLYAGYDSKEPMTIVGMVANVRQYGPAREPQPEIYMPYQQHFYNGATLHVIVRGTGDPAVLGAAVARKARERAPDASVRVSTMDSLLSQHVAAPRFRAWLLSLFAVVALCLAMSGVYGVMAYVASQRAKEIGVRMALGASAGSILWLMLGRGLMLTGTGLTIGVLGAVAASRLVSGMLFGVRAYDVVTYVGVVICLGLLSLAATYVPARRATRIDPLAVLHQE
jgi:predicted permease